MKLLAPTSPSFLRLIPSANFCFTAVLLAGLVGLELAGRSAGSDAFDALAGLALVAAGIATASWHRSRNLPWVAWFARKIARWVDRIDRRKYDHGVDLRGSPPYPRKLPRGVWGIVAFLVGWAGLVGAGWYFFPGGWREPAVQVCYVGYLVGLMLVWAGLLACAVAGLAVPLLIMRGHSREFTAALAYGFVVLAVANFVPTIVILGLCLVVAGIAFVAAARAAGPDPAILWRRGPRKPIRSIPLRRVLAGVVAGSALLVFNLLLSACGGRLFGLTEIPEAMPITSFLGSVTACLLPGCLVLTTVWVRAALRFDPGRRLPPTIHIRPGVGSGVDDLASAGRVIEGWGWKVVLDPDPPETGNLAVELVSADRSEATEFNPIWPLKLSLDDLTSGRVQDRLARRDEIQVRRQIFRSLGTLFKKAYEDRGKKGGGYWLAPQWWFVLNLDRVDPEQGKSERSPTMRPVGPPFAQVFSPRGRQQLHAMLRAVKVDMIYIEDGVSYKYVVKVLREMFELYDIHGGKRQAEDHHFRGIPKVKVMIHDYAPTRKKFRASGYREPKFDELSRARVMHLFRDNGGTEELLDVPFDSSWEPAPAAGL